MNVAKKSASKLVKKPAAATLLIELQTEELPPKSLLSIAEQFARLIQTKLAEIGFINSDNNYQTFATPRRLAVCITNCTEKTVAKTIQINGPSVAICFDTAGNPTKALIGFATKHGIDLRKVVKPADATGHIQLTKKIPPVVLANMLGPLVNDVLTSIVAPRMMTWGDGSLSFVRPVHGLLTVYGKKYLQLTNCRIASVKGSTGHRSLAPGFHKIANADDYQVIMRKNAKIIVAANDRRKSIEQQIAKLIGTRCKILPDDALLDELTAMCENPHCYTGEFDKRFLELPEAVISCCIKRHLRCLPLYRKRDSKMLPAYIFVADNAPKNPQMVINGFKRVVAARLNDARFYWSVDLEMIAKAKHLDRLANLTYHAKLGTVAERIKRLQNLSKLIHSFGFVDTSNTSLALQGLTTCKLDLATHTIGEYPELEGIVAAELFAKANKPLHHLIAGHLDTTLDSSDNNPARWAMVFICEIERLAGLLLVGEKISGDKDPHGMRKSAIRLATLLAQKPEFELRQLSENLLKSLASLISPQPEPKAIAQASDQLITIVLERIRYQPCEILGMNKSPSGDLLNSVIDAQAPKIFPGQFAHRLSSFAKFVKTDNGKLLIQAHKRASNILHKSDVQVAQLDPNALVELAEIKLHAAIKATAVKLTKCELTNDYDSALTQLAKLAAPTDEFFAQVTVNTEDKKLSTNRHALLGKLSKQLLSVVNLNKITT